MNRTEKQAAVEELSARLKAARSIYLTDFTGLNVLAVTDLRRRLRRAGVEYVVVKNTLARRALANAAVPGLDGFLHGPTALAVTAADPAAAAKVLTDFAKEFEKPSVRAAIVEGRAVTPEQVKRLASLPPRQQLLSELGAAMQAPLAALAGALQGVLTTFVGALEALRTQREGAA
jgi:large subunit ribosomal protein L10